MIRLLRAEDQRRVVHRRYRPWQTRRSHSRRRRHPRAGPHPSTGTKDPKASDILYIKALAAPDTINTIPEKTLLAFADHGALPATKEQWTACAMESFY